MTIGEQSVSAMIPRRMSGVSGASLASVPPAQPRGGAPRSERAPTPLAVAARNRRRLSSGRRTSGFADDLSFDISGFDPSGLRLVARSPRLLQASSAPPVPRGGSPTSRRQGFFSR